MGSVPKIIKKWTCDYIWKSVVNCASPDTSTLSSSCTPKQAYIRNFTKSCSFKFLAKSVHLLAIVVSDSETFLTCSTSLLPPCRRSAAFMRHFFIVLSASVKAFCPSSIYMLHLVKAILQDHF